MRKKEFLENSHLKYINKNKKKDNNLVKDAKV